MTERRRRGRPARQPLHNTLLHRVGDNARGVLSSTIPLQSRWFIATGPMPGNLTAIRDQSGHANPRAWENDARFTGLRSGENTSPGR